MVHGSQLRLQERLQLVAERAQRITGGSGAAIWLLRGSQTLCQLGCGILAAGAGQSVALEGSRLTRLSLSLARARSGFGSSAATRTAPSRRQAGQSALPSRATL